MINKIIVLIIFYDLMDCETYLSRSGIYLFSVVREYPGNDFMKLPQCAQRLAREARQPER